jgi:hypothetical protein
LIILNVLHHDIEHDSCLAYAKGLPPAPGHA